MDAEEETPEGFILYLVVDESTLDARDVGRISTVNSVVLITILDDNCEQTTKYLNSCTHIVYTQFLLFSPHFIQQWWSVHIHSLI